MKDHLKLLMSNVFDVPIELVNDKMAQDNCSQWDSLNQLLLITAIEEEFSVTLNDDDVIVMNSFTSIINILESKVQS
jgi:acyl carrier protein|tara:strand:- start:582 stop:812 length:231 start_codon:yes stop_codon:yes gene_type:complete